MTSTFFMSVENLMTNIDGFKKEMNDAYGFRVQNAMSEGDITKVFYGIMNEVGNTHKKTLGLNELNSITQQVARDYFTANYSVQKPQRLVAPVVPVAPVTSMPALTTASMPHPQSARDHDGDASDATIPRYAELFRRQIPDSDPRLGTLKEDAPDTETTDALLVDMMSRRRLIEDELFTTNQIQEELNNAASVTTHSRTADEKDGVTVANHDSNHPAWEAVDVHGKFDNRVDGTAALNNIHQELLNDTSDVDSNRNGIANDAAAPAPAVSPILLKETVRYICVMGGDRDITANPTRASFRINLLDTIRNVKSVKVLFVQMPMESNVNIANQSVFNFPLDNAFPFILLNIEELRPQYIGSNNALQRSFAVLTYVRHCLTNNNRGYTTFVSQNETLTFADAPLAQLSSLTISLSYPNGELYTPARDNHQVKQLDLLPATNPDGSEYGGLLRVMLTAYVDSNEYQVNDIIRLKNAEMTNIVSADRRTADKLVQYITRAEGLRIIGVEQTNEFGKLRSIFVKLPGHLNEEKAIWANDADVLALFARVPIINITRTPIWNVNLQVAIVLQVVTVDAKPQAWQSAFLKG